MHYGRLKLHVLNACHCALAYLDWTRYTFVREAIADASWVDFWIAGVDRDRAAFIADGPRLLAHGSRAFRQSANDYRLSQIAEDGSLKVAETHIPAHDRHAAAARRFASLRDRAWLAGISSRGKRVYRVRSTIRPCFRCRSAERRAARRHFEVR